MRIILASEYFYPASKGGTEMYVYQLAKELIAHGHECLVVSLSNNEVSKEYKNIQIKYIPFEEDAFNDVSHPFNLESLIKIVEEFSPDIFHLHTYTSSLGVNHLLKIKELGVKILFTSHLPNFTCLRGDLMLYGKEVCDGLVTKERCLDCYLQSTGINKKYNRKVLISASSIPLVRRLVPRLNQFDLKAGILNTFKNKTSNIVVVSEWQKKILELNGFSTSSISVCRQAIEGDNILHQNKKHQHNKLKIGFIGRIVNVKGLHLLLDVLERLDQSKFELYIVGVKSQNELDYYNEMREKANGINAIWKENLESHEVFKFLDDIDLLAIPSIWLETGPIVAFEALSRRLPILAFNYGGIKELTSNNESFLVANTEEMKVVLENILNDNSILFKKSDSISFHRSTVDMYNETVQLYHKIVNQYD